LVSLSFLYYLLFCYSLIILRIHHINGHIVYVLYDHHTCYIRCFYFQLCNISKQYTLHLLDFNNHLYMNHLSLMQCLLQKTNYLYHIQQTNHYLTHCYRNQLRVFLMLLSHSNQERYFHSCS
jgi:hypothetical protein